MFVFDFRLFLGYSVISIIIYLLSTNCIILLQRIKLTKHNYLN